MFVGFQTLFILPTLRQKKLTWPVSAKPGQCSCSQSSPKKLAWTDGCFFGGKFVDGCDFLQTTMVLRWWKEYREPKKSPPHQKKNRIKKQFLIFKTDNLEGEGFTNFTPVPLLNMLLHVGFSPLTNAFSPFTIGDFSLWNTFTLPETNIAPENRDLPKGKGK